MQMIDKNLSADPAVRSAEQVNQNRLRAQWPGAAKQAAQDQMVSRFSPCVSASQILPHLASHCWLPGAAFAEIQSCAAKRHAALPHAACACDLLKQGSCASCIESNPVWCSLTLLSSQGLHCSNCTHCAPFSHRPCNVPLTSHICVTAA